ncbi:MFS transporter [Demequina sp. B12]|uniref:MFS transporter n=1 Tax=Demequina sp. B12 TaxID=2992757 RepID=UPI00237B4FDB|nr:MFS transporter [Demequina sp. B12]MDE0573125.1 MFS transporter [Demequina sp. B12]
MTTVSSAVPTHARHTRLALLALALGGFGIGTTEFVAMGLLPDLARDLLPDLWATNQEEALGQAGWVISAYAAGVVVGAPTIAASVARFPRKLVLLVLAAAFTVGTVASALAPTFESVVAARFLAGLPHGAYFGIAALVAASLMGPGKRGQAVAMVMAGLTVANVVGVPAVTFLGQQTNWRIAYLVVAALFAAATLSIWAFVPKQAGDRTATVRRELDAFRKPAVWFALATGAIGFGGFFAVYSYVSPLATGVTGTSEGFVPFALMTLGVGMTAGNFVGGRLADRSALDAIFQLFGAFAVSLLILIVGAGQPWSLLLGLFLVGASAAALSPAIQTRLMDVAGDSQTMAAALNHSALNIGNALGAVLGGAVIAAGFGFLAPTWVGLLLCVPGALFALAGAWTTRRVRQDDAVEDGAVVGAGGVEADGELEVACVPGRP